MEMLTLKTKKLTDPFIYKKESYIWNSNKLTSE